MVRKFVLLAIAIFMALATIPIVAAARPGNPAVAALQGDDSQQSSQDIAFAQTDQTQEVTPPEELVLGERFTSEGFALEVQSFYTSKSLVRQNYSEIRVGVAFQNLGEESLLFSPIALSGEQGYPSLSVVDSAGEEYPLETRNPYRFAVPGSNLQHIPAGLPAHWTLGWQVPETQDSELTLRATWQENVVAEWNLLTAPRTLAGFDAPAGVVVGRAGEDIAWSEVTTRIDPPIPAEGEERAEPTFESEPQLTIRIQVSETFTCGAASLVYSAAAGTIYADVTNVHTRDAIFPGVGYPEIPMYAIWTDGTSARYGGSGVYLEDEPLTSFSGLGFLTNAEREQAEVANDFFVRRLDEVGDGQQIVAPGIVAHRALFFGAARDSRLVDVEEPPSAIMLLPPAGDPIWIDVPWEDEANRGGDGCSVVKPSVLLDTFDGDGQFKLLYPVELETTTTETAVTTAE